MRQRTEVENEAATRLSDTSQSRVGDGWTVARREYRTINIIWSQLKARYSSLCGSFRQRGTLLAARPHLSERRQIQMAPACLAERTFVWTRVTTHAPSVFYLGKIIKDTI